MNFLTLIALTWGFIFFFNFKQQHRRIQLLSGYLAPYRIEQLMRELNAGYMRALSEPSSARQSQIWQLMNTSEHLLAEQFRQLAIEFSKADGDTTRASLLSIGLPWMDHIFPDATFDMRKLLNMHAECIAYAVNDTELTAKERARNILAEIYLMQHSCHWFCKSKTVASARLLAQHQTTYDALLATLTSRTRSMYTAVVNRAR